MDSKIRYPVSVHSLSCYSGPSALIFKVEGILHYLALIKRITAKFDDY